MKRRVFGTALAALVLSTTALASAAYAYPQGETRGAAQVVTQATARPAAAIQWSECGTTFKGECATIPVPVDWGNPTGRTFQLAIGRLKALDPAKRIGVLFVHPGGPGGSGINSYIVGRGIPDDSPLRQYFDIVSFDQRGVVRSNPVVCSSDVVDNTPVEFPASQADYDKLLTFNDTLAKDCRKNTGPLFDLVDTTTAVRDVDALRQALGETKVSLYGVSYGTQFWQQYAERYPNQIRAMAIDSNMDHSITSAYDYLKTTTEDQEKSFLQFAGWCDKTAACALYGRDTVAVWDSLHTKAEAGQLIDPSTGEAMSAESLRVEMFDAMYRPRERWFTLATRLAALADGNPAVPALRAAAGDQVENSYPAIWCSDWHWDVTSFAQLQSYRTRLAQTVAPHTKLSPFWADITSCLGWSGPLRNPQRRLAISGTPPILMATSRYDVATPYAWNLAAASQVPNSTLLTYDGAGHSTFRNSPTCARRHIEAYLIGLTMPPAGTHCPADYPTQPASSTTPSSTGTSADRPTHVSDDRDSVVAD
ncbi:alpha/beta hydrolase [Flindersiella endophytica]